MIWPWLLFDYYHPKSPKSRFAQCFQWFCNHSEKTNILAKNRITLENTALYPDAPEDSERRHCSCQALSLCKKARRKLMHLSLRLAFARTDCPPWHIVYLWGETVEASRFFSGVRYRTRIQEKLFSATNSVKFCDKQFWNRKTWYQSVQLFYKS